MSEEKKYKDFIGIQKIMIKEVDKKIKRAKEYNRILRWGELETYKSGLEQSIVNFKIIYGG